jgi:hypothetical protein
MEVRVMTTDIDIFAGVEFCEWPARSERKASTLRWPLHKGIRKQVKFLEGTEDKGLRWYFESCGIYYCQLRVLGVALVLDDAGHTTFKANSPEEAIRIYGRFATVLAPTFETQIIELISRVPPREHNR